MPVRLIPSPAPLENVDDPPAARRLHAWRDRLRAVERGAHVDVEDALPLLRRDVFERPPHLTQDPSGVVHQDIDAARRRRRVGDKGLDGEGVAHIGGAYRADAAGGDREARRLAQLVFEHVASPHARAALRERQADGASEPVGGAGDQDCLVLKHHGT